MKIDFPYPGYEQIAAVEVPDANLLDVYSPRSVGEVDEEAVLARGFAEPHSAPRLCEAVHRHDHVLILIEDGTRCAPMTRVLPYVLEELHEAGVSDASITLLTAQGTHREMAEDELRRKLGQFFGRFKVHQHRWLDESNLHEFGATGDGTRVTANRLLAESDFVLGLGSIVPHRIKGFSGGAKIVFPGVAGREMQERNQWEAAQRMSETVMGVADNPMRLRMEEAARLVGLRYIVNLVSDGEKKIVGCFVGDPVKAHRAGCHLSHEINAVALPRRADIVLIDSHPADRDFWQSAKGVYAGTMVVRNGGTLILVAPDVSWANKALRGAGWLTVVTGTVGFGFHHYYGIVRKPGGYKWLLHYLMYGAPQLAPLALACVGVLALIAASGLASGTTFMGINLRPALFMLVAVALTGAILQAGILHYRGAFNNPAMYAPLTTPPASVFASLWMALAPSRTASLTLAILLWLTFLIGFAGLGMHLRGMGRQMGGLYVALFNWLEGPPAFAPALFAGFAAVGLITVHLL